MANKNFIKARWKNILSYGNQITEFHFKPGFQLIRGKKGQGKSTLEDIISFCVFGKPFRKIQIRDLINRKNNKGLWTEITFEDGDDVYIFERGLKPDILKIYKNGKEEDLESHKSLIQDFIDKIIGANYNLSKQVISLSILNNKAFLTLDAKDKREISESIFNIKVFGRMLKVLKKNHAVTKNSIEMNDKELGLMKENLESLVTQIKSLNKVKDEFDLNKTQDLTDIMLKLETFNKDFKIIEEKILKLEFNVEKDNTVNDLKKTLIKEDIEKEHKHWIKINNQKVNKESDLKYLEDSDDYEDKYSELRELVSSFYKEIKILETNFSDKKTLLEKDNSKSSEKINEEIIHLRNNIKNFEKEKSLLTNDYIEKNLSEVIEKNKTLTKNKIDINNFREDIALLKSKEGYCSHCKQEVSEDHKLKEISTRESSIKTLDIDNKILIGEIENIISKHIKERNDEISNNITGLKENIQELVKKLSDSDIKLKTDISLLKSGVDFSIKELNDRKSEVVLKYVESLKITLKSEIKNLESDIKQVSVRQKVLESSFNVIEIEEKEYFAKKSEYDILKVQKDNCYTKILELNESLKKVNEREFNIVDVEELKTTFETKKKNYQELKLKNDDLKKKLKVEQSVEKLLDENGIKKFFFSRLIPKLNQSINEYLNFFELPVTFSFNELFEETITEFGKEINYYSFSGGERFSLDRAIDLSFIKINKLINNFNCNILFFDELLDSLNDDEGMEIILEKLKELTDKDNLCSYVISHRDIESSIYFDDIIRVKKVNGFSKIELSSSSS